MFKNERVFISGGAGVIGQALVQRLYDLGAIIFVGDLKPRPKQWSADIHYCQGDLNFITKEELADFSPNYFFHLAATFERSVETFDFWEENNQHNVRLSHHLIDCLRDSDSLKKVIFTSSYLIYNQERYNFLEPAVTAVRLKESDPIYPRNLCGVAKLLHEMELYFLTHFPHIGFETVSARIFRVYGKGSRDVISRWIRALLKGELLTVYRKEGLFDYIYADDVAEGLIRLAASKATGIVNLGTGCARRVEEVVNVLKHHFPNLTYIEGHLDIPYEASEANMDQFQQLTGWIPPHKLEDAIPKMIDFEKNKAEHSESQKQKNVLVTSISKKIPLLQAVKLAAEKLGNIGQILGADLSERCIGKYFVDAFWQMPRIDLLSFEDLLQYCKEHSILVIIPTRDGELSYFAKHKAELEHHGIKVMVSDPQGVQVCLDKLAFFEVLKNFGFPVISTTLEINDLDADLLVVKERYGAGSRSIGLQLTRKEAIAHAKGLKEAIFQPFIAGQELSVDIYRDTKGRTKGVVVRTRSLVIDGESQITETIRNERLEQLSKKLVEELNLTGHVVLQVIVDSQGQYHIIECNSRFGGASTLSIKVGLESFYWFLLEAQGNDISEYPFIRTKKEMKLVRHMEDVLIPVNEDVEL
jgi:carbamoyl-phosphate synthase large subunit